MSAASAKVYRGSRVVRELTEYFVHLANEAGVEVAERFLENAEASFQSLADQPLIGSPVPVRDKRLQGVRKWRVKQFDNYLIFYLPRTDGVQIVSVLHASRDWWGLFDLQH